MRDESQTSAPDEPLDPDAGNQPHRSTGNRSLERRRERSAINGVAQLLADRAAANARESLDAAASACEAHRREQTDGPRADGPATSETATGETAAGASAQTCKPPRWPGIVARILIAAFAIAALVLLCTEVWLFNNWAALSIDEIMYHLHASLAGTNTSTITDYVFAYGTVELLVAALIVGTLVFTYRRCSLRVQRIAMAAILAFGIASASYAILDFDSRVKLFDYLGYMAQQSARSGQGAQGDSYQPDDFVAMNYVDPGKTDLSFPESKRNLIFIYLESMELSFADTEHGGISERNVIPELCTLAEEGECFAGDSGALAGGHALPGATWTTAAMFGSTAGVPLKLPFNNAGLASEKDFFPAMTALGDLLAEQGYVQELMIGSDAAFGGRDLYYRTHGRFNLLDYNYAIAAGLIPSDYYVWWGYEDEKLFSFARNELLRLAADGKPFDFTLLTVDTHFPDGWLCRLCPQRFEDQYSNVYACSSRQVSEFVRWVQKQDFYENTTIVITGDHPTMDAEYCASIPKDYDRCVYTTILNPAPEALADFDRAKRRDYSTFDLFPTTMAALGVRIDGNRLGLGSNLFAHTPTIVERYGLDTCTAELEKPSSFLEGFTDEEIGVNHLIAASHSDWFKIEEAADGTLTFSLVETVFRPDAFNDICITLADGRTGFSRVLSTTRSSDPAGPNVFYYSVDTNLTWDDLPYLVLTATITTDHFKNYPICKLDGASYSANLAAQSEGAGQPDGDGNGDEGGEEQPDENGEEAEY